MTDPHMLWVVAQLVPGEGIEDGVARIAALLAESRDCRTCARFHAPKVGAVCDSIIVCTNADRYQLAPPVRLWRVA